MKCGATQGATFFYDLSPFGAEQFMIMNRLGAIFFYDLSPFGAEQVMIMYHLGRAFFLAEGFLNRVLCSLQEINLVP